MSSALRALLRGLNYHQTHCKRAVKPKPIVTEGHAECWRKNKLVKYRGASKKMNFILPLGPSGYQPLPSRNGALDNRAGDKGEY